MKKKGEEKFYVVLDEYNMYDGYNQASLGSGVVKMDDGVANRVEKTNKFEWLRWG